MKLKVDDSNLKPCSHMEILVSCYVDGNLTGVKRWYAESHIKGCKQCQASIPFLIALKARTLTTDADDTREGMPKQPELTNQAWARIRRGWDEAEML